MSKSVKKSAKTVQDAISLALADLKLSEDQVTVEVLEEGSKGIFGIGAKDAVVQVTSNVNPESRARDFLEDVFTCMGVRVTIDIDRTDKLMNINLSGENMGIIIGKHGDTLDALEHLVSLAVNRGDGDYVKIVLDRNLSRKTPRYLGSSGRKSCKLCCKQQKENYIGAYEFKRAQNYPLYSAKQ